MSDVTTEALAQSRVQEEVARIIAEREKFVAERIKLTEEGMKLRRERFWYPAVVIFGSAGAGAALATAITHLSR